MDPAWGADSSDRLRSVKGVGTSPAQDTMFRSACQARVARQERREAFQRKADDVAERPADHRDEGVAILHAIRACFAHPAVRVEELVPFGVAQSTEPNDARLDRAD